MVFKIVAAIIFSIGLITSFLIFAGVLVCVMEKIENRKLTAEQIELKRFKEMSSKVKHAMNQYNYDQINNDSKTVIKSIEYIEKEIGK